ncbi:hypothetical protein ACGE0T_01610 [Parabacteroides sp. APC149_11_2_Y6]
MKNLLGLFLFIMVVLASCTKGLKDDVDALQKPVPSGLVLLEDSVHKVVKGEEFEIYFRINPTGIELTKENIELDFIESDTYLQYTPEFGELIPISKASYVTPSGYYECVALEADKNEAGEVLDGQWVLTVKTKGEANFMNKSSFFLVLNYTDATGQKRLISSSTKVNAQIFPTIDEGLVIGYSKGQTYRGAASGDILPYQILLDANYYKNDAGKFWEYDRSLIAQVDVTPGEPDIFAVESGSTRAYITLTPTTHDKWTTFEQSEDFSVSSSVGVKLTDVAGTTKEEDVEISYYKSEIVEPLVVSASELKANGNLLQKNLKEWLDKLGITEDFNKNLHRTIWGKRIDSPDLILYLTMNIDEDAKPLFKCIMNIRGIGIKPGEETEEGKETMLFMTWNTTPQEDNGKGLYLYDVKIKVPIKIVE